MSDQSTLENAWIRFTSADPENWSYKNPAWGQCAITALVVQDILGGELIRGMVGESSHYWNKVNGRDIDLTLRQFPEGTVPTNPETRERSYLLSNPDTKTRYQLLWDRLNWIRKHA